MQVTNPDWTITEEDIAKKAFDIAYSEKLKP